MSKSEEKKLLVAIDGSRRSIDTMRYITEMPVLCGMQIHLFHVFGAVPEAYWDLQKEPTAINNFSQVHAWESQNLKLIEEHINNCKDILLANDVNPKSIHINISKRKKTVAQDIMTEAQKGYEALVMRRRGMTKLQKLVLGSTAQKLLNALNDVPIIFAGRKKESNKVLLAFDGSDNSFRAVEFACNYLKPGYHEVNIISVLRSYQSDDLRDGGYEDFKYILQLRLETLNEKLDEAVTKFRSSGFAMESIKSRVISDAYSRAGTIVDFADKDEIGTIIAGRRGNSLNSDYPLGRVSQKILQLGAAHSVWIIN